MREQNDLNQPSSQQQQADSNAIATELAGVRHELRELKEQINSKKLITSNQIAAGILKAFGVLFLLYFVFYVFIVSGLKYDEKGVPRPNEYYRQSPN
ncbi:MAG: hypothetical protein KME30_29105 [Iphinoe sp. HA4291-MV1]|jgi:hypothetical protein|nr:hypothetical protein [Iphinoe sp. HA4291-MV1]